MELFLSSLFYAPKSDFKLHSSVTAEGNGMCFPTRVVSACPTQSFQLPSSLLPPPWHLSVPVATRLGRGLLQHPAIVRTLENPTASGSSCSSHLHHLPVLTPLLLVCSASHFPLESACFVWQKRAARQGCLQHWFGGKNRREVERGKGSFPKSSYSHEP